MEKNQPTCIINFQKNMQGLELNTVCSYLYKKIFPL